MKKIQSWHRVIALLAVGAIATVVLPNLPQSKTAAESLPAKPLVDPLVYHFNILNNSVEGIYIPAETESWYVNGGKVSVANSCLQVDLNKAGMEMTGEADLALTAALYPGFKIRLLNRSAASHLKVSFITDTDVSWTEDKSVLLPIVPSDTIFREYTVDARAQWPKWRGTVKQVKLAFDNAAQGRIEIDRIGYYPTPEPSDIEFDFSAGQQGIHNVANGSASFTSVMKLASAGAGTAFDTADFLNIDAAALHYVQLMMQNDSPSKKIKVYFTTMSDRQWNEAKSIVVSAVRPGAEGLTDYTFNMTSVPLWKGRIKQLRVVFPDSAPGGSYLISGLNIRGGRLAPDMAMRFASGCDWTAEKGAAPVSQDGAMKIAVSAGSSYVQSPALSIDSGLYGYIKLNVKNATRSSALRLQWITDKDGKWDEKKAQTVLIDPNSGYTQIDIPLMDNQYWKDTVSRLRVLPALYAKTGEVFIKNITFSQSGNIDYLNRNIREGFLDRNEIGGWSLNSSGGLIAGQNDKKGAEGEQERPVSVGGQIELNNNGFGAPVEAWKELPGLTAGTLQWDFTVVGTNLHQKTGNRLELRNRETGSPIFQMKFEENQVKLLSAGGAAAALGSVASGAKNTFRVVADCDARAFDIYRLDASGTPAALAENVPFMSAQDISEVCVSTTGDVKLAFGYTGNIYKVNEAYEQFDLQPLGGTPNFMESNFAQVVNSGQRLRLTANHTFVKLEDNSNTESAYLTKRFTTKSNVVDTLVQLEFSKRSENNEIRLMNGAAPAAIIRTAGSDFVVPDNQGGTKTLLTKYEPGVLYTFKIRAFLELGKAEVSVNGSRPVEIGLPAGLDRLDSLTVASGASQDARMFVSYLRAMDYQPSTVPYTDSVNKVKTTGDGYIGVNTWNNDFLSAEQYYNHAKVNSRESLLGYIDCFTKESTEWQLKYMAENGIDFSSYFYVFDTPKMIDTHIDLADNADEVKFAFTIDATEYKMRVEKGSSSFTRDDVIKRLIPYVRERYARNPNYLVFNNKPVIFIFAVQSFWDKELNDEIDDYFKEVGFDGAELIYVWHNDTLDYIKARGFDTVTNYWHLYNKEKIETKYADAKRAGFDYIPSAGPGGDPRFWGGVGNAYNQLYYSTPSEFYNACVAAKSVMQRNDPDSIAGRMVFLENWSEYGEGHSISPFGDIGFGYLNQVRRVFTDADQNHRNSTPSALYDAMFPKGWFKEEAKNQYMEDGTKYWSGSNASIKSVPNAEFAYHTAAIETTRGAPSGALIQDVTAAVLKNGQNATYNMGAYLKAFVPETPPPKDDVRELVFIPAGDPSLALGLTDNKTQLLYRDCDSSDPASQIRWKVEKRRAGYFTLQNVETGKYLTADLITTGWMASYGYYKLTLEDQLPETANRTQVFFLGDEITRDGAPILCSLNETMAVTCNNANWEVNRNDILDHTTTNIRTNSQVYTAAFTENNDAEHTQKWYRNPAALSLEITDSAGTHSYTVNGKARGELYQLLAGQVPRVTWTGTLKSAVFKINGDTSSANPFYADHAHFRLVPPTGGKAQNLVLAGGWDLMPTPGDQNDILTNDPYVNEILNSDGRDIVITLTKPGLISPDILKAARIARVSVILNYIDMTGKLWYSWAFDGRTLVNTQQAVNTRIMYSTPYGEAIGQKTGSDGNFFISLANAGSLPGVTKISARVDGGFADGSGLNLYRYDAGTGKIYWEAKKLPVENGFVTLALEKGKEYFLNLENAIDHRKAGIIESPGTGDRSGGWLLALPVPAFAALVLLLRKRGVLRRLAGGKGGCRNA